VGWLCRRYLDGNLGLDAIRPINWAKALGPSYSVADDVIEWPPHLSLRTLTNCKPHCPLLTQSGHGRTAALL
jgi:hypothetical protein